MATDSETAAMRRAVALSASVGERTSPNPNVGAVVLAPDGAVVGEGRHERAGGPHAEVVALAAAGERARGGTVVVTLEPCAHTGRTGPCADALLAAGVSRVVYAVADPTVAAAGGAARLAAAGVEVDGGVLADEAAAANERWLTAVRTQRPFVVWKVATTLDGKVAAPDGTSRWITSAEARFDVHRLRAECDAVVAGALVPALADDGSVGREDDGADVGVGAGALSYRRGQRDGAAHGRGLAVGGHRALLWSGRSGVRRRPTGSPTSRPAARPQGERPTGVLPPIRTLTVGPGVPPGQPCPSTWWWSGPGSRTVTAGSEFHRPRSTRARFCCGSSLPRRRR